VSSRGLQSPPPQLSPCRDWDSKAKAKEEVVCDKLTLGSDKHVHWAAKCPLGLPRKYALVNSCVLSRSSCGGWTTCNCSLLLGLHPEVAQEEHCGKNDRKPNGCTAKHHAVKVTQSTELAAVYRYCFNYRLPRPQMA